MDQDTNEILDQYFRNELSDEKRAEIQHRLNNDPEFNSEAERHFLFLQTLENAGRRDALKNSFDLIHQHIPTEERKPVTPPSQGLKRLWPAIAVAASVALLSVVTTILTMQNVSEAESKYIDLRRNVEQIQRSQRAQKAILDDIANKKADPIAANYTGTGFMVSGSGYIATSYHVISDADSVFIQNERFGILKAIVVRTDQVNDVAILKIEDEAYASVQLPFVISQTQSDLGAGVFTLGFPREEIVYGEGTISAATGYKQNVTAYQIAVPVNPGNSGGPLVNQQGEVVGMISGIQTEALGAAFAVKSNILLDVINNIPADSLGKSIQLSRYNKLKNHDRTQQVKRLRDYVFMVKVYNQQ